MKFRPCIDLHGGCVKQIVGSTLTDETTQQEQQEQQTPKLATNFSTEKPASEFAQLYRKDALTGGHVIMLGPGNTAAAKSALTADPGGLQVGGGINTSNAQEWLDAGASHVIVTSFVFRNDGVIDYERLEQLVQITGKERLVLDLSCRKRPNETDSPYYVVTNKWQTFTNFPVTAPNLTKLAQYCDEFLIHGVDVEGQQCGILEDLVEFLGQHSPISVTYAGGVRSLEDLELVRRLGRGRVDCTVGSALDIFGGALPYRDVVAWHKKEQEREQEQQEQES